MKRIGTRILNARRSMRTKREKKRLIISQKTCKNINQPYRLLHAHENYHLRRKKPALVHICVPANLIDASVF